MSTKFFKKITSKKRGTDLRFIDFKKRYEKEKVVEYLNSIPETPLVSVCVQTFQHANYIKDCLEGILMQKTDFPFEILIGEDSSTDGTREICLDYAKKYPNKIRLFLHNRKNNIYIENKPSGRFNFLYNFFSANGDYIALCEGDDYWTDSLKLQKQVNFLNEHLEFNGCFHNTNFIDNKESNFPKPWKKYFKQTFDLNDTISTLALFHTSSFLFRSKTLILPDWITEVQSGDMALFSLISLNGKLFRIDEVMSIYRKNDGGITTSISKKEYHSNRIKLWDNFREFGIDKHTKLDEVVAFHQKNLIAQEESKIRWYNSFFKKWI